MENNNKPKCKLIGEDSNIYNLMAIAFKCLKSNGQRDEGNKMVDEVTVAKSYHQALSIIAKYVDIE